jgi:hypothetical protein
VFVLWREFDDGDSLDARIVRDIHKLDQRGRSPQRLGTRAAQTALRPDVTLQVDRARGLHRVIRVRVRLKKSGAQWRRWVVGSEPRRAARVRA